jgi:hypothetical protein
VIRFFGFLLVGVVSITGALQAQDRHILIEVFGENSGKLLMEAREILEETPNDSDEMRAVSDSEMRSLALFEIGQDKTSLSGLLQYMSSLPTTTLRRLSLSDWNSLLKLYRLVDTPLEFPESLPSSSVNWLEHYGLLKNFWSLTNFTAQEMQSEQVLDKLEVTPQQRAVLLSARYNLKLYSRQETSWMEAEDFEKAQQELDRELLFPDLVRKIKDADLFGIQTMLIARSFGASPEEVVRGAVFAKFVASLNIEQWQKLIDGTNFPLYLELNHLQPLFFPMGPQLGYDGASAEASLETSTTAEIVETSGSAEPTRSLRESSYLSRGDFEDLIELREDMAKQHFWTGWIHQYSERDQIYLFAWRFNPTEYSQDYAKGRVVQSRIERVVKPLFEAAFSEDPEQHELARQVLLILFSTDLTRERLEEGPYEIEETIRGGSRPRAEVLTKISRWPIEHLRLFLATATMPSGMGMTAGNIPNTNRLFDEIRRTAISLGYGQEDYVKQLSEAAESALPPSPRTLSPRRSSHATNTIRAASSRSRTRTATQSLAANTEPEITDQQDTSIPKRISEPREAHNLLKGIKALALRNNAEETSAFLKANEIETFADFVEAILAEEVAHERVGMAWAVNFYRQRDSQMNIRDQNPLSWNENLAWVDALIEYSEFHYANTRTWLRQVADLLDDEDLKLMLLARSSSLSALGDSYFSSGASKWRKENFFPAITPLLFSELVGDQQLARHLMIAHLFTDQAGKKLETWKRDDGSYQPNQELWRGVTHIPYLIWQIASLDVNEIRKLGLNDWPSGFPTRNPPEELISFRDDLSASVRALIPNLEASSSVTEQEAETPVSTPVETRADTPAERPIQTPVETQLVVAPLRTSPTPRVESPVASTNSFENIRAMAARTNVLMLFAAFEGSLEKMVEYYGFDGQNLDSLIIQLRPEDRQSILNSEHSRLMGFALSRQFVVDELGRKTVSDEIRNSTGVLQALEGVRFAAQQSTQASTSPKIILDKLGNCRTDISQLPPQ